MTNHSQNTQFKIFVTHVVAEGPLLKIYGQTDQETSLHIEKMMEPLTPHFAKGLGRPVPQSCLTTNLLCCAMFEQSYYRARILNMQSNGSYLVQFIDYGNTEIVDIDNIRVLNQIAAAEVLANVPPQGSGYYVYGVLPKNGSWSDETINFILKNLRYNEYLANVVKVIGSQHSLINMLINNQHFAEFLVNQNLAVPANMEEIYGAHTYYQQQQQQQQQHHHHHQMQLQKPVIPSLMNPVKPLMHMQDQHHQQNHQQLLMHSPKSSMQVQSAYPQIKQISPHSGQPLPQYRVNPPQENWRSYPPSNLQSPSLRQPKSPPQVQRQSQDANVFTFKSRPIEIDAKHEVTVSYVEDGPLLFSVQLRNTAEELATLMRSINSHTPEPLVEPPLIGSVCLGRYSVDKRLLRAVVMKVTESCCKLHYVDYGYGETLPYPEIFQIPPQYTIPAVMAVRFALNRVNELNVTEKMKQFFKALVNGRPLLLHVRPNESSSPLIRYGDLYESGRNVLDLLRLTFPDEVGSWQKCCKLVIGTQEIVFVVYVESCYKFFVQLDREVPELEALMAYITEYAKTASPVNVNQLKIGLHCIALSSVYCNWCRAEIIRVAANVVTVFFVDYGNEETIPVTSIRLIRDPAITKLRAQAIRCILNGYDTETSTAELNNSLEAAILDQRIAMVVKAVIPAGPVVELFDPNTNPMESILRKLKQLNINGNVQPPNSNDQIQNSPNISTRNDDQSSKWNNSSRTELPRGQETTPTAINGKPKNWKDEENEHRRFDNRYHDRGADRGRSMGSSASHNDRFSRDEAKNERFSREGPRQDRNDRNERYERSDETNGNSRGGSRGGRFSGNNSRTERNGSGDKSWSDKDSDTSSRGSGRNGRRGSSGGRGGPGRGRRETGSGRTPNNRENDGDSDRSFKSRSNGSSRARDVRRDFADKSESKQFDSWANKSPQSPATIRIPPPNITVGAVKNCDLVFMKNPTDFQVQLSPDNLELDAVMVNIEATYRDGGGIVLQRSMIKPGTDCVAQYSEDNQWYRATIQSVGATGATVYFVDYGNTETVEFSKLKELDASLAKLAAQAIACKLLAASKSSWDPSEIAKFEELAERKILEAEFVSHENKIYEILLREIVDGTPMTKYINEEFSAGADLNQAKNIARNKGRQGNGRSQIAEPTDYAPLDQKWPVEIINPGSKQNVIVTWFTNPDNFFCQTLAQKDEFRTMMNDIQRVYAKRAPMTEPLQVGSAVIAVFSEDGAMYRAEILELDKARGNIVRYVDFGNCAMVEPRNTYRVEKQFMKMSKQAVQCSLKNVVPANGSSWSKSNRQEIDKCFDGESYECSFHEIKDGKYIISLSNGGVDVAGQMVEKSLAAFAVSGPVATENKAAGETTGTQQIEELPRFDISLLAGQVLRVKVSNVASVAKFHIQLPSASLSDKVIDGYMAENDPKVMPRLSCREVCLGAGCLVNTDEGWRRAVVINCSRTTGFDVRLIDTGANDEIPLDCMLALPGELSVMQNQAVECCLKNSTSSLKVDEDFREQIENKDVIIVVDEVDNNRLIVDLYDTNGKKFKLSPSDPDATISTLCPMPILHSTHNVIVSHAEHSSSVWLKRTADVDSDAELLGDLYDYYSTSGKGASLIPDALCAAKSSDGNWYRAKVIHMTRTGVLVQYLDYGNTEDVELCETKALEPQFLIKSQLALEVALTVTLGGSKEQQQEILVAQTSEKKFTATIYNVRKNWVAELTNDEGKISEKLSTLNVVEVSKNREVQPDVPEMVVGERYKVVCTHADSPAQFWLQRDEEIPIIEQLQEKLQIDAPNYPGLQGIPELNTLCVAMFSVDDQWYRAEVLDADEDIITIRFIDFGNTDIVDTNGGKIKQIPDALKATKRYATKCRLDVIPYGADDWMYAACEYFQNVATSTENTEALVIADSNPRRVELFLGETSAVKDLVQRNYATKIHTEDDLIDEIVEREIDPRAAYVSHAISPSEFWVQQEKFVGDLEILADRFIVADMFPRLEEIKEGLLCVAKFPEDECWYRARVVSHADSGTEVIYIDYGNSAISTEIRAIPEDLAALPPFSKKCSLALPEGIEQWSEDAETEFVKMAAEGATIFLLDVIEEGNETSIVRLTQDNEDIVVKLAELCEKLVPVIEERLPPLGEENSPNVLVSHVNSPAEFWTQRESSITELETMGDHLTAAESFLKLETIEEGTICAAKFPEDGLWYRAIVLSHGDTGTEVQYIDYGNSAITTELRRLPEDIVNIPALSMSCSLNMPEDVESWSQEACEKFFELVNDGITMFKFEILEEKEQTLIRLITPTKIDVVDILAPLCAKKQAEQLDNSVEIIEDTKENTTVNKQSEIQHVKEIVEEMVDNVKTFENKLDTVEQIISEQETNSEDKTHSSNTSGVEVTNSSDKTTFSCSTNEHTSEESSTILSATESKSQTEAVTTDSVPSTLEYAESVAKKSGLENSAPESDSSIVEIKESAVSGNILEVSVPDSGNIAIGSSTPEVSIEEEKIQLNRPKTPIMNKILPGSISRGLSEEDIIIDQIERRNSVPNEDKIVPGSINKGEDVALNVSLEKVTPQENAEDKDFEQKSKIVASPVLSKKLDIDDKIVPGSISRGESPVAERKCPTTPKTPHSEKLVAGVVNLQEKLTELEADESITVVVEENIPK